MKPIKQINVDKIYEYLSGSIKETLDALKIVETLSKEELVNNPELFYEQAYQYNNVILEQCLEYEDNIIETVLVE